MTSTSTTPTTTTTPADDPSTWRDLPTEPGTIIAWTVWYDGPRYGCAVLETDELTGDPIWFRAGWEDWISPARLRTILRDHWTEIGRAPALDR